MEGRRKMPRRSWKERLERFLSRIPRIRIPFTKPRARARPSSMPAGRRAETPAEIPTGGFPLPVPSPAGDAAVPVRERAPALVLAGAGAEASLDAEAPDPRPPRGAQPAARGVPPILPREEPPRGPDRPADKSPASSSPPASAPDSGPVPRPRDAFVPFSDSGIVLLALDPYRAEAWWEARPAAVEAARRRLGDAGARLAVRFHEISLVDFDGSNANETIEVAAAGPSGNHYLNVWSPGKCFVAELIVRAGDGRSALLARSNFIELPRDGESHRYEDRRRRVQGAGSPLWRPRGIPEAVAPVLEHVAEAALASEDEPCEGSAAAPLLESPGFEDAAAAAEGSGAELIATPAGAGAAVEGGEEAPAALEARIRLEAGGPSSWVHGLVDPGRAAAVGTSSLERPALHEEPHLEVKADLVIYGRTQPGTEVVIDGVRVPVRADGTFDLRFALPRVVEPPRPRSLPPGRPRRHSRAERGEP
jgi:hypothetical protein